MGPSTLEQWWRDDDVHLTPDWTGGGAQPHRLIKEAFDPRVKLFSMTVDHRLYPNPWAFADVGTAAMRRARTQRFNHWRAHWECTTAAHRGRRGQARLSRAHAGEAAAGGHHRRAAACRLLPECPSAPSKHPCVIRVPETAGCCRGGLTKRRNLRRAGTQWTTWRRWMPPCTAIW